VSRLRIADRAASLAAGVLLVAAAAWALAGAATEKEKGACAVLLLAGILAGGSAHLLRFSVPVTFMVRAPAAVAAYAMTGLIGTGPRHLVYLALVPQAAAIATVLVRVLEDVQTRPVSHL
jgi:hypothetical protein